MSKPKSISVARSVLSVLAISCCTVSAFAQTPNYSGDIWSRSTLTGDWGGVRSGLAAHGIFADYYLTQFYQGVVRGSPGTSDGQYGVKGDLIVNILGEKLGLWPGLSGTLHLETRGGKDVNGLVGLSPANAAMLMPSGDNVTALTHAVVLQDVFVNLPVLGEIKLVGGKVNAFDFADLVFHTGRGIDSFMNMSLVLPLGLGQSTGLAIPVGGIMTFKGEEVSGVYVAYDPNNCATTSCLDPFFNDAAILAAQKFFTGSPFEGVREGYIAFGGTYSWKQYTVVDRESFSFAPGEGISFTTKKPSWSLVSIINQPLWADPTNPNRNIRFMGMYSITDGVANPIKWSATAALEMNGPVTGRDKDVLGVGFFHNGLAGGFKDVVGPLLSAAETIATGTPTSITVEDTTGFEIYYKAQVTPWFALTGDLQVITETLSSSDTHVVAGVRGKITF